MTGTCDKRPQRERQQGDMPGSGALVEELRPVYPARVSGSAGCETWNVDFSPDGSRFAWSMGYGVVKVFDWPAPGDSNEKTLKCEDTVWGLAFGPRPPNWASAGRQARAKVPEKKEQKLLLATGLHNGTIKVWGASGGDLLFDLKGHQSLVRDLEFTPNGTLTLVSGSRDKTLRVWDLAKKGKNPQVLAGHGGWVVGCSVSPDSSMVASVCSSDNKVYLWSLRSYTFIRNLNKDDKRQVMTSCDFSLDGAVLAVGSYNSAGWSLDLWDPYTSQHLAFLQDCKSSDLIRSLRFSPDGLYLAFITDQSALRVWEFGQKTFALDAHTVTNELCCTFHPQGGIIATGTRDGCIKFWRIPRVVPTLSHICRTVVRFSVSTHQVEALPIPKKLVKFLTYKDLLTLFITNCLHLTCQEHLFWHL
uniref:SOCS box domain-containing protein n=1 Tax=Denticeps clupeoides TaxID=299321 RepID=A0AAY4C6D1_9TELE